MLCVLCLTEDENVIEIFEEEGQSLHIDEIVIKHFWLQPSKSNPDERVICSSCWKALSSFHEFYVQIEEAHRIHSKAVETNGDLKLENVERAIAINEVGKIPSDYLDSDIKLEVREDVEISQDVENIQGSRTVLQPSIDLESPPANSTRSRKCADIQKQHSQDEGDSVKSEDEKPFDADQEWQNEEDGSDSTGDDSDYVEQLTTHKVKQPTKSPTDKTKQSRKRKAESKSSESKKYRSSGVQHLNATRMREFDEIIAKHMKLSCAICQDILYPDFGALHRHFRSEHNECGYVVCCTKKFRKRGLLVDHIWTHQNPEYFKCERCNKVLVNRKGLESHMLTHDTEKQRIFQCDQCPFSSFTRPILTRHMQTHISERNIKCPQCDKFFSTQDILRTHINNVHNASYTRICDQCGKTFRRPDAFKRHQLEHDGITQPLIPCEECNVKLTSKYGLKRHMESMHPKEDMKHICSECGKVAPSAAALQRHISYMHKMERKHECPMCGKAFKKRSTLKEHMTTHTGEVLYTCPHCPKTFNSNANMHSHRKKMHRKEWEENRRHPHLGTSANAKANADAMAAAAAAAAAAEENNQQ